MFSFLYSKYLQFFFLNKPRLTAENPDQLFSIKLFGKLTQLNPPSPFVVRRENAGRKWYQDVIQLLQSQHKKPSRLQTVFTPSLLEVLQKATNPFHNPM